MTAEPWRLPGGYREGRAVRGCPHLGGGYGARGKCGQVSVPPGARPAVETPPAPTREGSALRGAPQGEGEGHPTSGVSGCLFRSQRTARGPGWSYQPGDPARAPASCSERWAGLVQTFGGAQLGHPRKMERLGQSGLGHAAPKPGLQPLWGQMGEMGKDVDG